MSWTSRALLSMTVRAAEMRPATAWTLSLLAMAAAIAFDVATGRQINSLLTYTLATLVAAWFLHEAGGIGFAILSVFVTLAINGPPQPGHGISPHGYAVTIVWNMAARAAALSVLAMVVNGLRSAVEMERWRASVDGLTGALNKAAFLRRMQQAVRKAQGSGHALVLAYMDLDGFKGVNDRHGHSAGDRVLVAFAEGACEAIRATDLFARIGGDEFVALLVVPDCARGDAVAGMLHRRLSAVLEATGFPVTCSMGALVADACEIGDQDDHIAIADTLMYEVKQGGKNALRIARGAPVEAVLRDAFPPTGAADFRRLLQAIDRADLLRGRRARAGRPDLQSKVTSALPPMADASPLWRRSTASP